MPYNWCKGIISRPLVEPVTQLLQEVWTTLHEDLIVDTVDLEHVFCHDNNLAHRFIRRDHQHSQHLVVAYRLSATMAFC